jgi:hypothetical protein
VTRFLLKVAGVCVATCALLLGDAAAAQKRPGQQGDTYSSIAKLPDWSGVWVIPWEAFAAENVRQRDPKNPGAPQLTPASAAILAEILAAFRPDNPSRPPSTVQVCAPQSMPNVMRWAFATEFLFTPGRVTILLEQGSTIRRIYTDGRGHSVDPDLTYIGESVGHWEGDTLVVHTTAIAPQARLFLVVPSSGKMQVTERLHRIDTNHFQIDTVVEDPIALRTPWRYTRIYERSDTGFFERECDVNNRDGNDQEPDLTPPRE